MLPENDFATLSNYIDGALADDDLRHFEARLTTEPTLRAALRDLRANRLLLRSLPTVPPPRHFTLTREQAESIRPRPRLSWRQWFPVLQLSTALATLAFVFTLGAQIGVSTQTAALPADSTLMQPMMAIESAPAAGDVGPGIMAVEPTPDPAAGRMADEPTPDPSIKIAPPPLADGTTETVEATPVLEPITLPTPAATPDWAGWATGLGLLAAALTVITWWSSRR